MRNIEILLKRLSEKGIIDLLKKNFLIVFFQTMDLCGNSDISRADVAELAENLSRIDFSAGREQGAEEIFGEFRESAPKLLAWAALQPSFQSPDLDQLFIIYKVICMKLQKLLH